MSSMNLHVFSALFALALVGCGSAGETSTITDPGPGPVHDALGCAAGEVVALAENQQVLGLALDATDVYWFTLDPTTNVSEIRKTPKSGGPISVVTSHPFHNDVVALALDEESVYWALYTLGTCDIYSRPKQGGPSKLLVKSIPQVGAMAVDAERIYWTDSVHFTVMSVPKASGGTPELIGSPVAPSGDAIPRDAIALDDERIFWTSKGTRDILTVLKSGGETTSLGGAATSHGFVLDDANLYWSSGGDGQSGAVMRMPKSGGTPSVFATSEGPLWEVAVTSTCAYWGSENPQGVIAASKKGGDPATVALVKERVIVAADESGFYWVDVGDQSIWRLKK